jgi:predicted ATPase
MLTRLRVSGFKNLLDLDLHFGPFTCIAGVNGAGKSNLFDAVGFLGALADRPLVDAAESVRARGRRATDVDSLFLRAGADSVAEMSFAAEMIVPGEAVDDLGQTARPSITFLHYHLVLARRQDAASRHLGPLEIVKEELSHINLGEAFRHLPFPHRAATWRRSAVAGSRRAPYFISTERQGGNRVVTLHQDGGGARHWSVPAESLPRTVLSAANAAESPTALAARREMQSWQVLRLEPSSLREPDDFRAPTSLGSDGAHLAATLHRLATAARPLDAGGAGGAAPPPPGQLYGALTARLSETGALDELGPEVGEIRVEADAKRELLTLVVTGRDGVAHAARSLSDGALRMLALAVLAADPRAPALLCLEEPENGIHPAHVPALLRLLQAIPTDADEPVSAANPLRQLIVNSHSPAVASGVPDDSLLVAEPQEASLAGQSARTVAFHALSGTWRAPRQQGMPAVTRAELLGPLHLEPHSPAGARRRRGAPSEDPQPLLPYS